MKKGQVITVFYGLTFVFTFLIVLLQAHEIISSSLSKLSMCVPALVAIALQKFFIKEQLCSSLRMNFKPRAIWLAPIAIAAGFVVFASLVSFALRPDYFRTFNEIAQDKTIARFSNHPIAGLAFIFAVNLLLAPLINIFLFFGEELGWRSFLGLRLLSRSGLMVAGFLWGIWHWPMIWFLGLNYPHHRVEGLFMFIIFSVCFHVIWMYWLVRTGSIVPIALAHGVLNWTGTTFAMFLQNEGDQFEIIYGPTGLIGLLVLIVLTVPHFFWIKPYLKDSRL